MDDNVILQIVSAWPDNIREEFEERAAIMEYDGGLSRQEAERLAYLDIAKKHGIKV